MEKANQKAISIILTISIIALLLVLGPANALTLSLSDFSNSNVVKGDKTSTLASIQVRSDERIQFNNITLAINENDYCSFSINGTILNGCDGISISLISSTSTLGYGYGYQYGYNYGYGYQNGYTSGEFTYNITLNTDKFTEGTYNIKLKTSLSTHDYSSQIKTITISSQTSSSSSSGGIANNITRTNSTNTNNPPQSNQTLNETLSQEEQSQSSPGITGAVIGALGKTSGTIIIVVIVLLAGSFVTLRIIRKRKLSQAPIEPMYQ